MQNTNRVRRGELAAAAKEELSRLSLDGNTTAEHLVQETLNTDVEEHVRFTPLHTIIRGPSARQPCILHLRT
jgi:hypothetical protein